MLIIDAHLDLAWNAHQWNRDILQSVHTLRVQETRTPGPGRSRGTVALPEMRQGRIALCFATLLARSTGRTKPHIDYGSPEQAHGIAHGQLAYYRALEKRGAARIITCRDELDRHIDEWEKFDRSDDGSEADAPALGFVISMEGADPILEPDHLEDWRRAGLRAIGLSHYGPGRYAGGTGTEEGVSDLGRALLSEMARLGVILDLTHTTDRAFREALDLYGGPILASHNNCRVLVPNQRQFSDDQLRAIIERGGVIGAAFDAWMLNTKWKTDQPFNNGVTLSDVADHIDHVCQLAGNCRHAAIGSDLDGGFGKEQSPVDLDTIADQQKLTGLLADRGYQSSEIAAIMHGNWLRLLRQSWTS